ncbi:hypothetical protein EU527_09130 [Candidatus Thorarchaeota archaeon]|nr:MAG: hypothetical protein EU527_09130 [Candidatus Thorarchaeota archaeon]
MRSAFNGLSCLGLMFILGGGFLVLAGPIFGWSMIGTWIGAVELFIGLILVIEEVIFTRRWNRMVGIIRTHDNITLQEAVAKTGAAPDKVGSIIYEAISLGELSGRFDGETYSQS